MSRNSIRSTTKCFVAALGSHNLAQEKYEKNRTKGTRPKKASK
jgi:hypothetical protein